LAKTNADQATLAAEAHPNDPAVHIAPQIAAEARNKKPKHTIQSFTALYTALVAGCWLICDLRLYSG
jgi:hypothetical protein